ncbi:MAG: hypothetical protein ACXU9M_14475 [Thermodesulfobacteriota bacterium]
MFNLAIDVFRAVITGAIFLYLRSLKRKEDGRFHKGWIFVPIGFGLIFFGSLLDITDNFPYLNKYVVIGNTKYEEFLEQVIGYFVGFVFVAIGFWKWIPSILTLRKEERVLKKEKEELQLKIKELTAQLNAVRLQLEQAKASLNTSRSPQ